MTTTPPYLVKAHAVDGASNVDDPGVDAVNLAGLQPVLCVQLADSHRGRQGRGYDDCDEIKCFDCHVTRRNLPSDLWGEARSLVIKEAVNITLVCSRTNCVNICEESNLKSCGNILCSTEMY